ncbi:hypothetical protein [Herbaspirillum sp. YR522]|uniref:hypothetical protein n=1 Tax=Herbaspirillum sp. YR522 TaxID=1144342 RepID=UPI00026FB328|nr:hypothetical protein [Herbaspirillum sp. YR522]EJN08818.1 hypothetical protein PMI40_01078 [Herbaspirillum sp. YR522]
MANVGPSGAAPSAHFNDTVEELQTKKDPSKAAPAKSALKPTAPVVPATEEQLRREQFTAEFLRGALGPDSKSTKKALGAFVELGKQQSSRLKPEMKTRAEPKTETEQEPSTTTDKP